MPGKIQKPKKARKKRSLLKKLYAHRTTEGPDGLFFDGLSMFPPGFSPEYLEHRRLHTFTPGQMYGEEKCPFCMNHQALMKGQN